MNKFRLTKVFCLALLLYCSQSSAMATTDPLQTGIQKFNAANYTAAKGLFAQAVHQYPHDAYRSYWLGLTFLKLKDYSSAYRQFWVTESLDADGQYTKPAQQGINYAIAQSRFTQTPISVTPNKLGNEVVQALNRVNEQGQSAAANAVTHWNDVARADQESSQSGVAAIQKREDQTVRAMQAARIAVGTDGDTIPAYTHGEIASVAKTFDDKKNNLARVEQGAQANAQTLADYSARTIRHDVNHLSEQLVGNEEPAGLKLVATGTNLYTRNYAVVKDSNPATEQQPEELQATPEELILSPHKIDGMSLSHIAKVPTATPAPGIHLSVKATLAHR